MASAAGRNPGISSRRSRASLAMQPNEDLAELFNWVVAEAPKQLPTRRAKIYRGLATIIGNECDARELMKRAKECDAVDRNCRQLRLRFGRGNGGAS